MPKRLAITIAGAVSLGSYEAGVLYEVLDAIHQHNCVPGTPDEERIEIDVLTGASAGAMTAAIVAQKMLYAADEFRDPYDNPLYNVWVKQINLVGLLNTTNGGSPESESPLRSIFSSNMVERIAAGSLTARYAIWGGASAGDAYGCGEVDLTGDDTDQSERRGLWVRHATQWEVYLYAA